MRIDLITLFPEWFASPLDAALLGKARASGLVDVRLHNPRDLTDDRHHTVDDRPYGGGPGMVMMPDPLCRTLQAVQDAHAAQLPGTTAAQHPSRILLMAAAGKPLTQAMARELALEPQLTIVCGRYEGIDARVGEVFHLEPVSVGEAVLNGGEAAALLVIEAVTRLIPGFMGKEASGDDESFSDGLLEYPHYTRPEVYADLPVPTVLRSGDHARIRQWRRTQSLAATWTHRPDMLETAPLTAEDLDALYRMTRSHRAANTALCLAPDTPCPPDGQEGTGKTATAAPTDTEPALTRHPLGRNLHVALVHSPVLLGEMAGGRKKIGVTSLTNLDVHDIARCSCCYGLAGYTIVTPLADQRRLLDTLVAHWTTGPAGKVNPDRAAALELVHSAESLEQAIADIERLHGQRPLVIGTSARPEGGLPPSAVRAMLHERPVLLVLGTGHGLAEQVLQSCDGIMRPLRWLDAYNHFPVRGAAAVLLDRILGDRH